MEIPLDCRVRHLRFIQIRWTICICIHFMLQSVCKLLVNYFNYMLVLRSTTASIWVIIEECFAAPCANAIRTLEGKRVLSHIRFGFRKLPQKSTTPYFISAQNSVNFPQRQLYFVQHNTHNTMQWARKEI